MVLQALRHVNAQAYVHFTRRVDAQDSRRIDVGMYGMVYVFQPGASMGCVHFGKKQKNPFLSFTGEGALLLETRHQFQLQSHIIGVLRFNFVFTHTQKDVLRL